MHPLRVKLHQMQKKLQDIREVRIDKIKKLKELGINIYPSKLKEERLQVAKARDLMDKEVTVVGRIFAWREHGNSSFADIRDESGKIQIFFQKKNLNDDFKTLKLIDIGDFILLKGRVFKTQAGEITVDVTDFQLLTKSIHPLPSSWFGFKDVEERYRQRYIDLIMNPEVRKVFQKRTEIVSELRKFMNTHGFVEVETPILQPVYGGASAQPFITHHKTLDVDLYLRISDELYLKRLIVSGFEKVYEIGKVFRNEGIDRAHNPEFTMMEFYWAYANYEDLMKYSEEMLTHIIQRINGSLKVKHGGDELDFTTPWPRKTYKELLYEGIGIDIDIADSEEKLIEEIKNKKLKIDLKGVVGFGPLCDKLYKEFIRPKIVQPTFVIDYPSAMIALAKRKEEDTRKIASFQLLVKGYELIKAYNELNDPVDQKQRWLEEEKLGEKGFKEHMVVDEDYIRALEYGMPPTAGWGLGIDRLTAVLTNQHSLKEVILFPTLKPEK